ncbi:hypothetical protein DRP77_03965 [Candidatus Poribacteria bacterium]|nr:MAG: hypothetical protein DRP77_03965 [Candidatus Poribacteria bacterium]
MAYLISAYLIAWLALLGYLFLLHRRVRRIERMTGGGLNAQTSPPPRPPRGNRPSS